jgi:hypothetical protein
MRLLGIWAAVGVMVVAGACGGDDDGASTEGDTSTTTSTPATTAAPATTAPPVLTPQEAATEYLSIVEPYNTALEALEEAINGGQAVEALRTQADTLAAANATQVEALQAARWPPEVQPSVDALMAESEAAQPSLLQAAQAQSRQGVIDAVVAANQHDGADAAAEIRRLLGLDDYNEDDYTP